MFLNSIELQFVNKVKYLGVYITDDFKDDVDMKRQRYLRYEQTSRALI